MSFAAAMLAAVVVGTWNGNWFPSGRAEHRAHPDVEAATIKAAAKMLASALAKADPSGTNDVVLCLHEIRGPSVASNLVAKIRRKGLRVAVVSGYRRRDRFDQQQDVIATTLPVVDASWSRWKSAGRLTPPRGYAFATLVFSPAVTANVYAVHLKSNYRAGDQETRNQNRDKRALSIGQILEQEVPRRGHMAARPVIVAGDMNADRWSADFADERIFAALEKAGFDNPLERLPPEERCTFPSRFASHRDSALDYVFVRGLSCQTPPLIEPNDGLSDHRALFVVLE